MPGSHERGFRAMVDVFLEVCSAHSTVWAVEKKLAVETMVTAVKAMSKLRACPAISELRLHVATWTNSPEGVEHGRALVSVECGESRPLTLLATGQVASEQIPELQMLNLAGQRLLDILAADQMKVLQVAWLKTLLRQDKYDEVAALDSTIIAAFDKLAGELWRAAQAVKTADATVLDLEAVVDYNKTHMKNLMLFFIQMHSLNATDMSNLGFEDVAKQQSKANDLVTKTLRTLLDEVTGIKQDLLPGVKYYADIEQAVQDWSSEGLDRVFMGQLPDGFHNAKALLESVLEGCSAECKT